MYNLKETCLTAQGTHIIHLYQYQAGQALCTRLCIYFFLYINSLAEVTEHQTKAKVARDKP